MYKNTLEYAIFKMKKTQKFSREGPHHGPLVGQRENETTPVSVMQQQ